MGADRSEGIPGSLTRELLGAFYDVYNAHGFGFLESVYSNSLAISLTERGVPAVREAPLHVRFHGHVVGTFRADVLVDDRIIVEVKSTLVLDPSAERQLLNYLRGTGLELGFLLHFGPRAYFRRLIRSNPR